MLLTLRAAAGGWRRRAEGTRRPGMARSRSVRAEPRSSRHAPGVSRARRRPVRLQPRRHLPPSVSRHGRSRGPTPLIWRDSLLRAFGEALPQAVQIDAQLAEQLFELRRNHAFLTEQAVQKMAESVILATGRVVAADPDCVGEGLFAEKRQAAAAGTIRGPTGLRHKPRHKAPSGTLVPCSKTLILLVGAGRFERPTPCAQGRCATRLRYAPTSSAPLILDYFPNWR